MDEKQGAIKDSKWDSKLTALNATNFLYPEVLAKRINRRQSGI